MTTLHIEHAITDFDTWSSAFDRFADTRARAGVWAQRIGRPVDNPAYVVVDLDFDTTAEAQAFLEFVKTNVWGIRENSPGLAGAPETMILEVVPQV